MSAILQHSTTVQALIRALSKWPVLRLGELGTFVRKEQPARWDPEKNVIFPPTVVLDFVKEFGAQLSFSDYLIDSEGFSQEEAGSMAHNLQTKIVSGITESGTYLIDGLGKISKTTSGEFAFFTEESILEFLDDHSFGLRKVEAHRTSTAGMKPHEAQGKHISMKALSKEKTSPNKRLTGWKFFLVIALLGALGALVVQYGPWDVASFFMQSKSESTISTVEESSQPEDQFSNTLSPDSTPEQAITKSEPTINPNALSTEEDAASSEEMQQEPGAAPTPELENAASNSERRGAPIASASTPTTRGVDNSPASTTTESPVADMGVFRDGSSDPAARMLPPIRYFHLIAGSFNNAGRAQEFVNQMKQEGYDAFILFPEEGSGEPHRVSIYRNDDRQKVSAYAEKLKEMGRQAGWVFAERSFSN